MLAIYKRELKSFFHSMMGWLFIAAVIFLTGIYFFAINLMSGYSSVANTLASSIFIYILTIPLLTMRILSEERKQKIDQLTLTSPVSVGKIVFGKYLSMATVLMIPLLVVASFPLILSNFGTIAVAENYIAILGFSLYGLAAIAVGLFISSITESQVIAAILSFAAMFILYMMSGIASLFTSSENGLTTFIAKILDTLDFTTRFDLLLNGQMDLRAIIYFLTIILVFLFLTTQSIQKRRYSVSTKNLRFGAYSIISIVICIAVAVFANLMVNELPEKYVCYDVTGNKLYSLSDTTVSYMGTMNEDIAIYVLQNEASKDVILDSTLQKMAEASGNKLKVEYINPVENPTFHKKYTDNSISLNSVIVEGEKRSKVIDYNDIYEYEVDYTTYSQNITGYDGEGQIVSAIDYVTRDDMPVAYMITGHDELTLDSGFAKAIEKQNIPMEELNLMTVDAIPQETEFIMILAPLSDYSTEDAAKIIDYIEKGGQLFVTSSLVENTAESLPNFQTILDCFNTTIVNGMVTEGNANYYYGEPTYLLPEVLDNDYTQGVYGEKYVFMPYTQGIRVKEDDTVTYTSILQTTDASYAKANLSQLTTYDMEEDDIVGPFDVGVYVEKNYGENTAGLFVFGSGNVFTDSADSMVANANLKVFTNCISEFVDAQDGTGNIVVPVKSLSTEALVISVGTAMMIGLSVVLFIPLILLIIGFIIWLQRRKA